MAPGENEFDTPALGYLPRASDARILLHWLQLLGGKNLVVPVDGMRVKVQAEEKSFLTQWDHQMVTCYHL